MRARSTTAPFLCHCWLCACVSPPTRHLTQALVVVCCCLLVFNVYSKEECERQLAQLEKDIERLSAKGPILVVDA